MPVFGVAVRAVAMVNAPELSSNTLHNISAWLLITPNSCCCLFYIRPISCCSKAISECYKLSFGFA